MEYLVIGRFFRTNKIIVFNTRWTTHIFSMSPVVTSEAFRDRWGFPKMHAKNIPEPFFHLQTHDVWINESSKCVHLLWSESCGGSICWSGWFNMIQACCSDSGRSATTDLSFATCPAQRVPFLSNRRSKRKFLSRNCRSSWLAQAIYRPPRSREHQNLSHIWSMGCKDQDDSLELIFR